MREVMRATILHKYYILCPVCLREIGVSLTTKRHTCTSCYTLIEVVKGKEAVEGEK